MHTDAYRLVADLRWCSVTVPRKDLWNNGTYMQSRAPLAEISWALVAALCIGKTHCIILRCFSLRHMTKCAPVCGLLDGIDLLRTHAAFLPGTMVVAIMYSGSPPVRAPQLLCFCYTIHNRGAACVFHPALPQRQLFEFLEAKGQGQRVSRVTTYKATTVTPLNTEMSDLFGPCPMVCSIQICINQVTIPGWDPQSCLSYMHGWTSGPPTGAQAANPHFCVTPLLGALTSGGGRVGGGG